MLKTDQVRLRHILDAAQEAVDFAAGKTVADLKSDRMRALALTRCFEIIGEAAVAVSAEIKNANPQVPWRAMIAVRNRLIHAYFAIDLTVVLETAHRDLPPLTTAVEAILAGDAETPTDT